MLKCALTAVLHPLKCLVLPCLSTSCPFASAQAARQNSKYWQSEGCVHQVLCTKTQWYKSGMYVYTATLHKMSSDPRLQPLASHMYQLTAQCSVVSSRSAADITAAPHDSLVVLHLTASAQHPRGWGTISIDVADELMLCYLKLR